jgi:hypothetical protein
MYQNFFKYLKLTPVPPEEDCNLVAANGSPIKTAGIVNVDVAMQGYVQPWTFYVLKSLAHDVILAQDFLQAANAIIDCAYYNITLFDSLVTLYMSNRADSRKKRTKSSDRQTILSSFNNNYIIFPECPRKSGSIRLLNDGYNCTFHDNFVTKS